MREAEAVIAAVRLVVERELRVAPVERARVDHDAADARAVSADPLRERVDDDVRAVLDRTQQRGGREGRVHDERQLVAMGDLRVLLDVRDAKRRVADRLDVDEARLLVDRRLHRREVVHVREAHGDALLRKDRVELRERAAVEVVRRDDLVAALRDVGDREVDGRRAGGERQGRHAAVQRRKALLQGVVRRVHEAGVDVARHLEREQVRAVLRVVEVERRRAVHRHVARLGVALGHFLPRMDREGFQVVLSLLIAHVVDSSLMNPLPRGNANSLPFR